MNYGESISRILRFGYIQQMVALASMLGFNLLIPVIAGLSTFGRFTEAHSFVMLVCGIGGGGMDFLLARDVRSSEGELKQTLFWRGLFLRLIFCSILSFILFTLVPPLYEIPTRTGVPRWLIIVLIFAVTVSAHSVYTIIGLAHTRTAMLLSAIHAIPYFGLPLLLWFLSKGGAMSLFVGVLLSYLFIISVEVIALMRVSWCKENHPENWLALARNVAILSPNALFETIRIWGIVLTAAHWLDPVELAIGKTTYSISTALVSLTPVPVHTLVATAAEIKVRPNLMEHFSLVLRHTSVLAALSSSIAVALYGMLAQPKSAAAFLSCSPAVLLLTAVGPLSRVALAQVEKASKQLALAVIACACSSGISAAVLCNIFGIPGMIIAGFVSSAALLALILRNLISKVFPASSVFVLLMGAGTISLCVGLTRNWEFGFWIPLGIIIVYIAIHSVRFIEYFRDASIKKGWCEDRNL